MLNDLPYEEKQPTLLWYLYCTVAYLKIRKKVDSNKIKTHDINLHMTWRGREVLTESPSKFEAEHE